MEKKSVQQNMIFNTVGSLVYYVCQWLMSVLIVRISGYTAAGILSVAMSVTASPAIIGLFNIRAYQASDMNGIYSDRVYIRSRWITNMLSVLICIAMIFIGGYNMEKTIAILSFMLIKVAEGFADVYYAIEQKNERMDYTGISLTVRGIGLIILFVAIVLLTDNVSLGILAGAVFSLAVVYFYDRVITKKWISNDNAEFAQIKDLLIVCLPLAIVAFLNNLSINIPKLYLEQYFGSEIMGIYSSISSPTAVIQLAATTVFAPLVPVLTVQYQSGNKKEFLNIIKKFVGLILVLSVIALIGSKLLGRWGLVLLFGESIEEYVYLFVPVIAVSILIAVNASLFSICTLLRAIKIQYVIGIAGIAASLIMGLTVVKAASMNGVVYALIITMLIQILIQVLIIAKKVKEM